MATTFTSLKTNQGSSVAAGQPVPPTPAPRPLIFLTPPSSSQFIPTSSRTRKWKAKLEDPRLVRHKLVDRRGSICPRMVARSSWLQRGELALRQRERDNPPHSMWPLIPAFKHVIICHHHFPPSSEHSTTVPTIAYPPDD